MQNCFMIIQTRLQQERIYDPAEGQLLHKKERQNGHYWVSIFLRINSVWEAILLFVKEKQEYVETDDIGDNGLTG